MSPRLLNLVASISLLALIALCVLWEGWLAPLRPGGSWMMLKAVPLLPAIAGLGAEGKAAVEAFQNKNVHQLHLENFVAAVRAGDKALLACPGEEAYRTAVAVLKVLPAIEAGGGVPFAPADFQA